MSFVQMFLTKVMEGSDGLPAQAQRALGVMQGLLAGFAYSEATARAFPEFDVNAFAESVFDPSNESLVPGIDMDDVESLLSGAEVLGVAIGSAMEAEQSSRQQSAQMRLHPARFVQQVSELQAYVSPASEDDEDFI